MKTGILALFIFVTTVSAKVLDIKKDVIVHLFDWRWVDIAKECEEFLAPNGFAGVQISPPSENVIIDNPPRPWWERYQPISYYLTTRSGTEKELQDMLNRCNKVGVRVFADVVLNHMTGPQGTKGTGEASVDYKSYSYPFVEYTELDFHRPPCIIEHYNDPVEVRDCELYGNRDLDQSKTYVKAKQLDFLNKLIGMGVAGFRVDGARHMWPEHLEKIFDRLDNLNTDHGFPPYTRPLIYQEVMDYDLGWREGVKWSEYTQLGLVTDFRYGVELGDTFLGNRDLNWLKDFDKTGNHLPKEVSVVFVENHYTQRNPQPNQLNHVSFRAYKMAIAFMLAYPWGTPRLMSGYSFKSIDDGPPHDEAYNILSPHPIKNNICSNSWTCEHRWRQIYNMVRFHNVVAGTEVTNWQGDGNKQLAFCRGNKGFIAFNTDPEKPFNGEVQTCLPKGTYCDAISGYLENNKCKGKTVVVGKDGKGKIEIPAYHLKDPDVEKDGVLALHVKAKVLDGTEVDEKLAEMKFWCDSKKNQIAFCENNKGFIAFTKEEFKVNEKLKVCLPKGVYCDMISGGLVNNKCTGKIVEVSEDGTGTVLKSSVNDLNTNGKNYKILALHIKARLTGEEISVTHNEKGIEHEHSAELSSSGTSKIETPSRGTLVTVNSGTTEGTRKLRSFWSKSRSLKRKLISRGIGNIESNSRMSAGSSDRFCDELQRLITARDGVSRLSSFIGQDSDDLEILKAVARSGKLEMITDLVSLIQ